MFRFKTVVIILAVTFAGTRGVFGGEWHYGTNLVCSDCHTQHNSQNGQPMRTDNDPTPASMLLRRGTALDLCLSCHDGANAEAPDVVAPVGYVSDCAGGAFATTNGTPSAKSHHLNNATPEVPSGGTISMILSCTTCHDPHGNDNYRNLRPDPTKSGLTPITVLAIQTNHSNGSNPAQVYVPQNIIYKSGISKWCSQCHGAPTHHSVDKPLWASTVADYTTWAGVSLPRVPVHSPSDNTVPSSDDQVMCLSCHKAHGSDHDHLLIYADGTTQNSTCGECHNP